MANTLIAQKTNHATHDKGAGFFAAVRETFDQWLQVRIDREAFRRLQDMSDRELRDIGVTREDVNWAAGLPITENAAKALQDRAAERRIKEDRNW